jgi:hypothetical protein
MTIHNIVLTQTHTSHQLSRLFLLYYVFCNVLDVISMVQEVKISYGMLVMYLFLICLCLLFFYVCFVFKRSVLFFMSLCFLFLFLLGKYCSSICVSIFASLKSAYDSQISLTVVWIILIIISTAYNVYWDVFRDWGLGNKKYGYLRKERLYSTPVSNFEPFFSLFAFGFY